MFVDQFVPNKKIKRHLMQFLLQLQINTCSSHPVLKVLFTFGNKRNFFEKEKKEEIENDF